MMAIVAYKKILFAVAIIILATLSFFVYTSSKYILKGQSVTWKKYQSEREAGLLYILSDTEEKKDYLITAEKAITNKDLMDEKRFTLHYLDKKDIWNPKTCAKMPTTIKNNVLYMVDSYFNGSEIKTKFIKYSIEDNTTEFFDVSNIDIVGGLYQTHDTIFFFSKNKNGLYVHNFYTISNTFKKKEVIPLSKNDGALIYNRGNGRIPYIKITTGGNADKIYSYEDKVLRKEAKLPILVSFENTKYLRSLYNTKITYYDTKNFFNIGFKGSDVTTPILKASLQKYIYIIQSL
jgi:hypothetical protein